MSPNLAGALLMVASMVAFTVNDTMVKMTDGQVPLFQLIFLRGLLTTILIFALARQLNALRLNLPRGDVQLVLLRGLTETLATYLFLSALFYMPIGSLTAILQVLPLTMTLGAALLFKEPVGWRRLSAILIGFVGVMLIVKPWDEEFSFWSIYALGAVACVTVRDLATRKLSPGVPGLSVSLVTSVFVTLFAGVGMATQDWAPVSGQAAALIIGASFFILGGYFFSVQAMRQGDVSVVSPFRYSGLIAAMIAGYFVFDEIPDHLTILGALVVVLTGLFTLYREGRARRHVARMPAAR